MVLILRQNNLYYVNEAARNKQSAIKTNTNKFTLDSTLKQNQYSEQAVLSNLCIYRRIIANMNRWFIDISKNVDQPCDVILIKSCSVIYFFFNYNYNIKVIKFYYKFSVAHKITPVYFHNITNILLWDHKQSAENVVASRCQNGRTSVWTVGGMQNTRIECN